MMHRYFFLFIFFSCGAELKTHAIKKYFSEYLDAQNNISIAQSLVLDNEKLITSIINRIDSLNDTTPEKKTLQATATAAQKNIDQNNQYIAAQKDIFLSGTLDATQYKDALLVNDVLEAIIGTNQVIVAQLWLLKARVCIADAAAISAACSNLQEISYALFDPSTHATMNQKIDVYEQQLTFSTSVATIAFGKLQAANADAQQAGILMALQTVLSRTLNTATSALTHTTAHARTLLEEAYALPESAIDQVTHKTKALIITNLQQLQSVLFMSNGTSYDAVTILAALPVLTAPSVGAGTSAYTFTQSAHMLMTVASTIINAAAERDTELARFQEIITRAAPPPIIPPIVPPITPPDTPVTPPITPPTPPIIPPAPPVIIVDPVVPPIIPPTTPVTPPTDTPTTPPIIPPIVPPTTPPDTPVTPPVTPPTPPIMPPAPPVIIVDPVVPPVIPPTTPVTPPTDTPTTPPIIPPIVPPTTPPDTPITPPVTPPTPPIMPPAPPDPVIDPSAQALAQAQQETKAFIARFIPSLTSAVITSVRINVSALSLVTATQSLSIKTAYHAALVTQASNIQAAANNSLKQITDALIQLQAMMITSFTSLEEAARAYTYAQEAQTQAQTIEANAPALIVQINTLQASITTSNMTAETINNLQDTYGGTSAPVSAAVTTMTVQALDLTMTALDDVEKKASDVYEKATAVAAAAATLPTSVAARELQNSAIGAKAAVGSLLKNILASKALVGGQKPPFTSMSDVLKAQALAKAKVSYAQAALVLIVAREENIAILQAQLNLLLTK